MSFTRNALLVCCCVLLGVGTLSAAVLNSVGSGNFKPPSPDYSYMRAAIDCTPIAALNLGLGYSGSLVGDTTGGTNQVTSYPCAPWNESGPENIYQMVVAQGDTLQIHAEIVNLDPDVDHDLFLLNACDTDSCIVSDNTEFAVDLTEGTYFLIIDGYGGDAGPYTVDISVGFVGLPPYVCAPGFATVVDVAQPSTSFEGNLWNKLDSLTGYRCSPILLKGGETWFSLVMPGAVGNQFGGMDYSQFTVDLTQVYSTLDIGFWLFDGCGTSPVCLDYVNDGTAGQLESLTYRNESDQEVQVYLGVDCFNAPAELGTGMFSLEFTTDIIAPTEKTSFGSLRALYR